MIQDAMEGWLQVALNHNEQVPQKFMGMISSDNHGDDG